MAIQEREMRQVEKGNVAETEKARTLCEQFGDVSLVSVEASVEIKRFSPEQKEALEQLGFVILELTGQSLKTLRDAGCMFRSTWHKNLSDFEALPSMRSEVAIDPRSLFLPGSNRKTLKQQEAMVKKFSRELSNKVPGVKAIIGDAPDYEELAFKPLIDTKGKEYLLGEKYKHNYARTRTRTRTETSRFIVAGVGSFSDSYGLYIGDWNAGGGYRVVHAAPLVVPL